MAQYSLIVAFILLLNFFVLIKGQDDSDNVAYTRLDHIEEEKGLEVYKYLTDIDGKSIIIMIKKINSSCVEPRLNFRVVDQHGVLKSLEINNTKEIIPSFNFCYENIYEDEIIVKWYYIQPNRLLITYLNSSEISEAFYYALLITLDGKVLSNNPLSGAYERNGMLHPQATIVINYQPEGGFLFVDYITNSNNIYWMRFSTPNAKGEYQVVQNGLIEQEASISDSLPILYNAFSLMIEGGFGIIFSNGTNSDSNGLDKSYNFLSRSIYVANNTNNTKDKKFEWKLKVLSNMEVNIPNPPLRVYVTIINNAGNSENIGPFLIYQTPIPDFKVVYMSCDVAYVSVGYVCILSLRNSIRQIYWLKLSFLSYGSVSRIDPIANLTMNGIEKVDLKALWSGGYVVTLFEQTNFGKDNINIIGLLLTGSGNVYPNWTFPDVLKNVPKSVQMDRFRNNTYTILIQNSNNNSWSIISIVLPKLLESDQGYENPNIISSEPSNRAKIALRLAEVKINFKIKIESSGKFIYIYNKSPNSDQPDNLRQKMVASISELITISDDSKTLNIRVLESSFNMPNSEYYVRIEYNALTDASTKEPLFGIRPQIYSLFTGPQQNTVLSPTINGMLRLTENGTIYFASLASKERTDFLRSLLLNISDTVPVDLKRLSLGACCQYAQNQILVGITMAQSKNSSELTTYQIRSDLDTIIKGHSNDFQRLEFIDTSYGFIQSETFADVIQNKKFQFLGLSFVFVVSGVVIGYAKKKYREGDYIILVRAALTLADFILDCLFVVFCAPNIPSLYVPILVTVIIPRVIGSTCSITILITEITSNSLFYEWFKTNVPVTGVTSLMSCMEVELLNILVSNIGGLKFFNAPFSDRASKWIFRTSLFCFIISDIPKLTVLMMFTQRVIVFDIVQVLKTISSFLVVLLNVITRTYRAIIHFRNERKLKLSFNEKNEKSKSYTHLT